MVVVAAELGHGNDIAVALRTWTWARRMSSPGKYSSFSKPVYLDTRILYS